MYCYSSIQYLCEPCQAISARALPPESPYCLPPPTRLPPRRRLLSLILRSCLLREPSAPEAKVAAAKAPEAVNVQRWGKKQNKKKPHKGQQSPCLFLLSQPAVLVSSCGATCCRWRAASHVRMHGSAFIESQAAEAHHSRGSAGKMALIDIILRSHVFFVSFTPTIERKKLH